MANLLVFHQGISDRGRLWCNAIQDKAQQGDLQWQGDVQTPNTGMTASPSAVEFNGKVYCFHQGFALCGKLWYNVYDGMAWLGDLGVRQGSPTSDDNSVPVIMSHSPSAVVFNNQVYCFFQGPGENGLLNVASFDGTNWSLLGAAPNTYLTNSPSAVVFNGQIYVFHQGRNEQGRPNGVIWYNIYSGSNWLGDQQMQYTPGMSGSPSAVLYQGELYVFHQLSGDHGQLYYNVFNGSSWRTDQQVPNTGICMSESPSAAVLDDDWLYCFYQGAGKSGQLHLTR